MLKVLVFPCGSEVGLELFRSLRYSAHVHLVGASSVPDHGAFLYEEHIGGLPFVHESDFMAEMAKVVREHDIDRIFPATDSVIRALKQHEADLGCGVIASPADTVAICSSKVRTYQHLGHIVRVPRQYPSLPSVADYPIFLKPDVGYGSRGVKLARSADEAADHLRKWPGCIIVEYLPGDEYTVDCFTDRHGGLLFCGPRLRRRIRNGISVNTVAVDDDTGSFKAIAERINGVLELRGGWFFQVRESEDGELALLEVASRAGGSSSLYRNRGVNFALLSLFDSLDLDVEVSPNAYEIELDRALSNVYRIDYDYDEVYVDFDDCLLLRGMVNIALVAFLFQAINEGASIHLLTRHAHDIHATLKVFRLDGLFDSVIHLRNGEDKADHIRSSNAVFIDDSFAERKAVQHKLGIPAFAPDMVESLLKP